MRGIIATCFPQMVTSKVLLPKCCFQKVISRQDDRPAGTGYSVNDHLLVAIWGLPFANAMVAGAARYAEH